MLWVRRAQLLENMYFFDFFSFLLFDIYYSKKHELETRMYIFNVIKLIFPYRDIIIVLIMLIGKTKHCSKLPCAIFLIKVNQTALQCILFFLKFPWVFIFLNNNNAWLFYFVTPYVFHINFSMHLRPAWARMVKWKMSFATGLTGLAKEKWVFQRGGQKKKGRPVVLWINPGWQNKGEVFKRTEKKE